MRWAIVRSTAASTDFPSLCSKVSIVLRRAPEAGSGCWPGCIAASPHLFANVLQSYSYMHRGEDDMADEHAADGHMPNEQVAEARVADAQVADDNKALLDVYVKMYQENWKALLDVHLKMYQENWVQMRHHENQRSEVAKVLIGVAGAAIALMNFKAGLTPMDLPLTLFLFLLGGFGAVFSAKQHERIRFHQARVYGHRPEMDKILPGRPVDTVVRKAAKQHTKEFPWLEPLHLYLLWVAIYIGIAAIGLIFSAYAIFSPSKGLDPILH